MPAWTSSAARSTGTVSRRLASSVTMIGQSSNRQIRPDRTVNGFAEFIQPKWSCKHDAVSLTRHLGDIITNLMSHASCLLAAAVLAAGCSGPTQPRLTVAAAANLSNVFPEVGRAFTNRTGIQVAFSYGSTAQLAQQIAHGAPFDVFAAADIEHVDALLRDRKVVPGSRAVYARGQLALWAPRASVRDLKDLAGARFRFIAIAQPELAPYGRAAVEALKAAGLWEQIQSKLVYANNIGMAKQLAESGNADAAFTAYSLVFRESGTVLKPDPALYRPIEQALAIVPAPAHPAEARRFVSFLLGGEGQSILTKNGYSTP